MSAATKTTDGTAVSTSMTRTSASSTTTRPAAAKASLKNVNKPAIVDRKSTQPAGAKTVSVAAADQPREDKKTGGLAGRNGRKSGNVNVSRGQIPDEGTTQGGKVNAPAEVVRLGKTGHAVEHNNINNAATSIQLTNTYAGFFVSPRDNFLYAGSDPPQHILEQCPRLTYKINALMDNVIDHDTDDLGFGKKRLLPEYYYTSTAPSAPPSDKDSTSSPLQTTSNTPRVVTGPACCFARAPSTYHVIYTPLVSTAEANELKSVDFKVAKETKS